MIKIPQQKLVDINLIKPCEMNTKKHPQTQIDNIAISIKKYGFVQPLVLDKNNEIIIGHGRYFASKQLNLDKLPCVYVENLTDDEIRQLRIIDNKLNESEWDIDKLQLELQDINFDDFKDIDFGFNNDFDSKDKCEIKTKLTERFIVPPFSVFDSQQKYWKDRKKLWNDYGIKSPDGRKKDLCITTNNLTKKVSGKEYAGTSIFDPVLCEIIYSWFNVKSGKILDPFAGGSVRGIVAKVLNYDYTGFDISSEQITANYKNANELNLDGIKWINDDAQNIDKKIEDNSVDLIFSCPPYFDLEKYSNDSKDLSNMNYDDFCEAYKNIINQCCKKLKQDRFAVFVVGEVRNKKTTCYRGFVDFTKQCFIENGVLLYNDIVLLEAKTTSALRANSCFTTYRKVVKVHQNVLVFYKGDVKKIKDNYDELDIKEFEDEGV